MRTEGGGGGERGRWWLIFSYERGYRSRQSARKILCTPSTTSGFIAIEMLAETPFRTDVSLQDIVNTVHRNNRWRTCFAVNCRGNTYGYPCQTSKTVSWITQTVFVTLMTNWWSIMEINQDDYNLYIAGEQFKDTRGMYQLLFMRHTHINVIIYLVIR